MGFLKRLRVSAAQPATEETGLPTVDPTLGDPVAREWTSRAAKGDWKALAAFLATVADYERRDFYVGCVTRALEGMPGWVEEWVRKEPSNGVALLVRGAAKTNWAWAARGSGRAESVRPEAWDVFHTRLEGARDDLERAAALAPGDAGPWRFLLPVGMGLSYDEGRVKQIFEECQRRQPWHQGAVGSMVQAIGRKWSGSTESMLEFARWVTANAPDGAGVHCAIAEAHVEGARDAEYTKIMTAEAYVKAPGVAEEVDAALARMESSDAYSDNPYLIQSHNAFAFAYWVLDDLPKMLSELDKTRNIITFPWSTGSDAVPRVLKARRLAQLPPSPPAAT